MNGCMRGTAMTSLTLFYAGVLLIALWVTFGD